MPQFPHREEIQGADVNSDKGHFETWVIGGGGQSRQVHSIPRCSNSLRGLFLLLCLHPARSYALEVRGGKTSHVCPWGGEVSESHVAFDGQLESPLSEGLMTLEILHEANIPLIHDPAEPVGHLPKSKSKEGGGESASGF